MSTLLDTDLVAAAEAAYRALTPGSERSHRQACEFQPGGISGNVKFFKPYPPTMARAQGARLWDVDGNEYLDYLLVYGAVILGHGHAAVLEAVRRQLDEDGTPVFGTPHRREMDMARQLHRLVPSAEKVRFTNSGLEATLLCLRLAAAYTGRARIAKFEGHYHGSHDQVLVSYAPTLPEAGSAEEPAPVADSRGVPASVLEGTLVLPWNDWPSTSRLLRLHARDVAAVILEPVQAGFIPPEPGFLERLRSLTTELGVLLIFDEVKTGFRLGLGGAQGRFGVTPDLSALGKILGGGFPVGAVVGRAEVLDLAIPGPARDSLFHSGTYNGHPTAMAAGLAVLAELERPGVYQRLEEVTEELKARIHASARRHQVAVQTPGVGPVFGLVFAEQPPRDYRDLARADAARRRVLDLRLLARGVYSRPQDRFNLSLAHTEADIATTAAALDAALAGL
jgi:glutamate-1-semialdehyde 2,1-aminomutase